MSKQSRPWTRQQRKAIRRRTISRQQTASLVRVMTPVYRAYAESLVKDVESLSPTRRRRAVVLAALRAGIARLRQDEGAPEVLDFSQNQAVVTIDEGRPAIKRTGNEDESGLPPLQFGWL